MDLQSDANSYCDEELNFIKVSSFLISEDVKKFYFLLIDILPKLTPCPQTAEELFLLLKVEPVKMYRLLKELLFYTKKYKLLRYLQTCCHQMKVNLKNGSCFINSGRLLLFNLCEALKDSEVAVLKTLLDKTEIPHSPEWDGIAAEEFFGIWLRDITKQKITDLQHALPSINYKDINIFEEGFRYYFEEPFPITQPSVGNPCGLAIIFNFENFNKPTGMYDPKKLILRKTHLDTRTGTKMDEKILIDLWHKYGFDVLVFRDLSSTEMIEVIERLKEFHYNNYNVFITCILTHRGRNSNMIYTSDNIPLDVYGDIAYNMCTNVLQEKPKLLFIQACRENVDINENLSRGDNNNIVSDSPDIVPPKLYLMFLMSVIPLKSSTNQKHPGSWLVNELKNVLEGSNVATEDLRKLLNRVINNIIEQRNEKSGPPPEFRSTVMRPLYLKQLENSCPVHKLTTVNAENCPLLFQLITSFSVLPDVYLV
ncbi:caspase-8-like [Centruroides vittatus]|uniref:caspase-8-like n=1 Tax=Centruroides vittatus TaxID=120091 RepID=UPI00350FB306